MRLAPDEAVRISFSMLMSPDSGALISYVPDSRIIGFFSSFSII